MNTFWKKIFGRCLIPRCNNTKITKKWCYRHACDYAQCEGQMFVIVTFGMTGRGLCGLHYKELYGTFPPQSNN